MQWGLNMGKDGIKIGDSTIQYGLTPVGELLQAGYTISDFAQIIEEPTIATCNLNQNGETVAVLSFYGLKEKITIDQLADIPIDLLLESKGKHPKGKGLSHSQALRNRIVWTCLIHLFAAGIFFCIYAVPPLFEWVQKTKFRAGSGSAPVGMVLLVLPALLVTFIWGGIESRQSGASQKILLSLWLILNVIISTAYLVLIDNLFTHRFF